MKPIFVANNIFFAQGIATEHPDNLPEGLVGVYIFSDGNLWKKEGANAPVNMNLQGEDGEPGADGAPGAYPYTGLPKFVPTPASLTETQKKGQWSFDNDFVYLWVGDSVIAKLPRITGTKISPVVAVPANPSSTGFAGQMAFDTTNNFVYFCIATNTWRRTSLTLSTF